MKTYIRVQFII